MKIYDRLAVTKKVHVLLPSFYSMVAHLISLPFRHISNRLREPDRDICVPSPLFTIIASFIRLMP